MSPALAKHTTVVQCYELHQMTPEQIAESQEIPLDQVHAVLMQYSTVFRRSCTEAAKNPDITESEFSRIKDVMKSIAMYEDVDAHLKFKAARFLWDEYKGRNDPKKEDKPAINIQTLNVLLKNSNKERKELKLPEILEAEVV